ncbi:MAG: PEP-utilizing enzyme, partial [bacterium]
RRSGADIKRTLLNLTNNIVNTTNGVFKLDLERIEHLKERQEKVLGSSLTVIEKIYWLVEDCCRYGTLPFAGLARAGFIAVQMLRSFVASGAITQLEVDGFMCSLNTIAKQMSKDHHHMDQNSFLDKYGHLRPGTYDILSERYDEAYEIYFREKPPPVKYDLGFEFESASINRLSSAIKQAGFAADINQLLDFIKRAIEGREYAKFVFTKSVSEILKLVNLLGRKYGLTTKDVSFLNISTLLNLYSTLDHRDLSKILKEESDRNRQFFEITKAIKLPSVITSADDIFEFELEDGKPNFITTGRCQGDIVKEQDLLKVQLSRKIVFIPSADPGFDWVFSKNICGLITMYGGANSHMAIRAAELKIPSVVGAGEKNFNTWAQGKFLEIDCENRQVRILR